MLYAALGFWLSVVVLTAWGVQKIWSDLAWPKAVNILMLPGTLAAQIGHVLGLLITGGTVENTSLLDDDGSAAPRQTRNPRPRIPVVGPVVVAMLPLITCALGIVLAARLIGAQSVESLAAGTLADAIPLGINAFWQLLHDQIDLMAATLSALLASDAGDWRIWVFVYLLVCMTVRMAPFPGNLRGSLGAILLVSIIAGVCGMLTGSTETWVRRGWGILSLAVAALMLMLMISLIAKGIVALVRVLAREG